MKDIKISFESADAVTRSCSEQITAALIAGDQMTADHYTGVMTRGLALLGWTVDEVIQARVSK